MQSELKNDVIRQKDEQQMDSVRLNCSTNSFIAGIFKAVIQSGNKSSSPGFKQ